MTGIVFDIQRFALHDGPGIRTTVFLKGCPLRCLWCHNPESQAFVPQLAFDARKCQSCGACAAACRAGAHTVNGTHELDREACRLDGRCVEACPHDALRIIGRPMSAYDVFADVLRDRPYYERSGGGLTLSGGEPMAQFDFALALLKLAGEHDIHTCLDTSGATSHARLEEVARYVDLFLFDYKATDPDRHAALTGVSNELILKNLAFLYDLGAAIRLRCPLVPGVNDDDRHLEGIAALAERYPRLEGIDLLPFHAMGREKAAQIGMVNPLADRPGASEADTARWLERLRELGCTRARRG